jgi:propionate CoA-transferase
MPLNVITARDAANLVSDGDTLLTDGFVGSCFAEELAIGLEQRFMETGTPGNLTLVYCAGQGDGSVRGLNHLGHEGLLGKVIGGHWNLVPKLQQLANENKVEAYNLPQGVLCHMLRDIAAKKPGTLTHVGLRTFVDPRNGGGRLNERTRKDIIEVITIDGKEYLLYKTFPIHIAFLRGTYADENGNISMEHEGLSVSLLSAAQAVRNSRGKVIVQVEKIVKAGSIHPRLVKIPGIYVDAVVVATSRENHMQTFGTQYEPAFSGEISVPLSSMPAMKLSERKIICRRAAAEIARGDVVNLGIGLPEGIGSVANEMGITDNFVLTVESGTIGGVPQSGLDFGCSLNPQAIIDQPSIFDSYHGGGLDLAFLGMAEADRLGNINVSRFGPRIPGAGGFIDITQNARTVVFCGSFMAKGLKIAVENGELKILEDGTVKKFVHAVEQVTFSGEYAVESGQRVLYITERAVFGLGPLGMELLEIAPGVDLNRDILSKMDFRPVINQVKFMESSIFSD